MRLLDRAGDRRENRIGMRSYELDRAYHDNEDHRQHNGVLRDVLSGIIFPEFNEHRFHSCSPLFSMTRFAAPTDSSLFRHGLRAIPGTFVSETCAFNQFS